MEPQPLSQTQKQLIEIVNDFQLYCSSVLKIKTKSQGIQPLTMNRLQRKLMARAADQKRRIGKVRRAILKARQGGASTIINARGYHQVTSTDAMNAFILTHRGDSTDKLFAMLKLFYEESPLVMRPEMQASNKKELLFSKLRSGYSVGTAGGVELGRGGTVQFFHGSEVAYWDNAQMHMDSIGQSIPSGTESAGTEIWLESTSAGPVGLFYDICMDALRGIGEYELDFFAWFESLEYQLPNVPFTDPSPEDKEYQRIYKLTDAQMSWRRVKIIEMKSEDSFRREYPATVQEAFSVSSNAAFIPYSYVEDAVKRIIPDNYGAVIMGVDPARSLRGDRTAIVLRQGRKMIHGEVMQTADTMQIVGQIRHLCDRFKVVSINVDVIGVGAGVVDRLRESGFPVFAVNSATQASLTDRYHNKRAEMWAEMRAWLADPIGVQIIDNQELLSDLQAPINIPPDSLGRLKLESKDDMRKRGVRSPDWADALSFTFAVPMQAQNSTNSPLKYNDDWIA
jgi:hypothetical protein